MYSPSGHPKCRWVCFFIRTDLEKFSITALAQQWILCSEWVPSEWVQTADKNITIIHTTLVHLLSWKFLINSCFELQTFFSCHAQIKHHLWIKTNKMVDFGMRGWRFYLYIYTHTHTHTHDTISIEHVNIFPSKYVSKGAVDLKLSPDVGNNPSNPCIQIKLSS